MAIQVSRTLNELKGMADALGITDITPSGKNGRLMKEDLIWPIREKNILLKYGSFDRMPDHMKWVLSMKSVMLALRMDELKESEQQENHSYHIFDNFGKCDNCGFSADLYRCEMCGGPVFDDSEEYCAKCRGDE